MTAFQVMLSFISATFLTLSLFYFLRILLVTRRIGKYFFFALSALGCAFFAFFELLLSRDLAAAQVLLFHRLKLASMLLFLPFLFACVYEIFFRSLRAPRVFMAISLLLALALPFPFLLQLPVRHVQVTLLGMRFDYHFATYGPGYWLLSLYITGAYGFSILKTLRAPLRWRDKGLALLAFIPAIAAGFNDFAVARGAHQGIRIAEYVIFLFLVVIFSVFFIEEQRDHRRLQRVNVELERQVGERTAQLQQANDDLSGAIEKLRLANLQKIELMEMAAQDLKNPLQAVLGNTELLLRHSGDGKRVRRQAEVIRASAERMLGLIDEMLESAALESGEIEMKPLGVDLAETVRSLAPGWGDAVDMESEGSCLVQADPLRLEEIVESLVANARRVSPPGRPVRVRVGVNGPWVRLEIEDEGPGMSPEEQGRIFDKFRRRDDRAAGGGLGLYIVKKLVELQGGGIGVQSEPGRGARFTVIFPRATERTCRGCQ